MTDAIKMKRMVRAAGRLVDAIMQDNCGFCIETLHRMVELSELAGLPDRAGVTAVTGWQLDGGDEVRFWGEGALPKKASKKKGRK